MVSVEYLIYRWAAAGFYGLGMLSLLHHDLPTLYKNQSWKFFIYLTNWGLLLLMARTALDAVITTRRFRSPEPGRRFRGEPLLDVLVNLSNVASFTSCIAFWIFVYKPELHDERYYLNHFEHTMPLIFALIETWAATPRKDVDFVNIYQPFLFYVFYILHTMIFEYVGATNHRGEPWVYPLIPWRRRPKIAAKVCILVLLTMVAAQSIFWVISQCRKRFDQIIAQSEERRRLMKRD